MWTTRFYTQFRDDDNGLWRVDIQAPDYQGAAIELEAAGNPLEWKNNGSEDQTENIISGTGSLRLVVTESTVAHFATGGVLPDKALNRRVIVTREALAVWVGYIQMQTFNQDWEAAPVEIELPLMDTVEALSSIYIDNTETAATTMQLMRSAYAHALQGDNPEATGNEVGGVSLTDFARSNIKEYRDRYNGQNGKDWTEAQVFPGHYFAPEKDGKPGERKTYTEALTQILSPFGRLSQVGARWLIVMADVFKSVIYKPDPANTNKWLPVDMSEWSDPADISSAIAGADNSQSVLPAPSKVTATYEAEEGAVDFSGDIIVQFDADNIKSNSCGGATNVAWYGDEKLNLLRYMRIASGDSDAAFLWPVVVVGRHHMVADYYQYRVMPDGLVGTQYRSKTVTSGLLSGNPGPWCQVVQDNDGWKVVEDQTLCLRRTFNITLNVNEQGYDYLLKQDIVTLKVLRELVTSSVSVVKLTMKGKVNNLTKEADFSGADHTQKIYHPCAQIYWHATPDAAPTKVLNTTNGQWDNCDGYFFPGNADHKSMVQYFQLSHGKQFHLPGNRGYVSIRIYASGWTTPGQGAPNIRYAEKYYANRDKEWIVISDLKLEYTAWVGEVPTTLLEWNDGYADDKEYQYNNGSEEVSLRFSTLAASSPSASALLAPRWGFCDYAMNVVRSPREMVDIDAVQVTEDGGIPGVTRFSLFTFDSKTYFPAAVGMNARENTVRLKLIRTL